MIGMVTEKLVLELGTVGMNVSAQTRMQESNPKRKTPPAVLIADTDPSNIAFLTNLVEGEGFSVLVAADGRQARRILQNESDVIAAIFKVVIPYISGPDLVRFMRREKHLRKIPVIMMTQSDSIRALGESVALGPVVLLPKPFSTSQIRNVLHMLVDADRRRLLAEEISSDWLA